MPSLSLPKRLRVFILLVISLRQTHCHSWSSGRNDVYDQKFKWLRSGIKSSEARRIMGWKDEKITELPPASKDQQLSKMSFDEHKHGRDTYQNGSNVIIDPFDSSLNSDVEPTVVKDSIMTRKLLDAGSFGDLLSAISELLDTPPDEWSFQQILLFLCCLAVLGMFFSCCCAGTLCCCARRRRGCGSCGLCGCCERILLAFCCYEYLCNDGCDPCSGGDYVMGAGEYV
jgi:hypothetical protein